VNKIDILYNNYKQVCARPWKARVSGAERVWFAVYDKEDERRIRRAIDRFEEATLSLGYHWKRIDLTDAFAEWLTAESRRDFAEGYFRNPSLLSEAALNEFRSSLVASLIGEFHEIPANERERTVAALTGIASLYEFARISDIVPKIEDSVPGRLLIFFPGSRDKQNYRLLDARDGWNYHALPITCDKGSI
jgi:hypothetical protein